MVRTNSRSALFRVPLVLLMATAVACDSTTEPPAEQETPNPDGPVVAQIAFLNLPAYAADGVVPDPPIQVELQDSTGARVPVGWRVNLEAVGAGVVGSLSVPAVQGVATFRDVYVTGNSSQATLRATAGDVAGQSSPFTVGPVRPTGLEFRTQPSSVGHLVPMTAVPQVAVLGADGSVDETWTDGVQLTLENANGSVVDYAQSITRSGVVNFLGLTIDRPGTYTLTASSEGVPSVTSDPFVIYEARPFPARHLAVGTWSACAISDVDGLTYCWGRKSLAPVGFIGTYDSYRPIAVFGNQQFNTISIGDHQTTCGIEGTKGYCWGDANVGPWDNGPPGDAVTPRGVGGTTALRSLHPASGFGCGLAPTGEAYCVGQNDRGQLGAPVGNSSDVFVPVAGTRVYDQIETASSHTCGLSGSEVFCWGGGEWGQLGTADSTSNVPVLVPLPEGVVDFSVGSIHSCAVTLSGSVYCWGDNRFGQLGDGTKAVRAGPQLVAGGLNLSSVTAGGLHSCGLDASGTAFCWGSYSDGPISSGPKTENLVPYALPTSVRFQELQASIDVTCGIGTDGYAYCWGDNHHGQLGDGTTTNRLVPVRVGY